MKLQLRCSSAALGPKSMETLATCSVKNRSCLSAPQVRHAGSFEGGDQKSVVGGQIGPIWITALTMTCIAIQEVHLHSEEQLRGEICCGSILEQDNVTMPSQDRLAVQLVCTVATLATS